MFQAFVIALFIIYYGFRITPLQPIIYDMPFLYDRKRITRKIANTYIYMGQNLQDGKKVL